MPLGVQNVFVFNQGARNRRWTGALPTVLTAAVCDSLLIFLAVNGVSTVVLRSPGIKTIISGVGVLFLLVIGYMTWKSPVVSIREEGGDWGSKRQILFAASVSLLNPHAIIDTIGVIGSSSLAYGGVGQRFFTGGCLLNSWLWFFGLMFLGHRIGTLRQSDVILKWLNRLSAVIIWGCAILLGMSIL